RRPAGTRRCKGATMLWRPGYARVVARRDGPIPGWGLAGRLWEARPGSPRVHAVAGVHARTQRRDRPRGVRVRQPDHVRPARETALQHLVLPPHLLVR